MMKEVRFAKVHHRGISQARRERAGSSELGLWLTNSTPLLMVALIIVLFAVAGAIADSGPGNPASIGTVPQTSLQSGLIKTPNPVDSSGNLIITGNVQGGKHFRDSVPYQSTTNLDVGLGSSSLDSFLRLSEGPSDVGQYTGSYQSFYSPTGTVSIAQPGYSGVLAPTATRISGRISDAVTGSMQLVEPTKIVPEQRSFSSYQSNTNIPLLWTYGESGTWQMPRTACGLAAQEMDKLISDELGVQLPQNSLQNIREQTVSSEQYETQMEQIQHELKKISQKVTDFEQSLSAIDTAIPTSIEAQFTEPEAYLETQLSQQKTTDKVISDTHTPSTTQTTDLPQMERFVEPPSYEFEQPDQQIDITEKTAGQPDPLQTAKQQLDKLTRLDIDHTSQIKSDETENTADMQRQSDQQNLLMQISPVDEEEYYLDALKKQFSKVRTSALEDLSDSHVSARAKAILGTNETIETYSQQGYSKYIHAAQMYLNQGKYYRAADSYSVASIYKPKDPNAYGGRSHALFAAGQYFSSALFLAKALQINPEYAQQKVDLVAMFGDKNKLEKRIEDFEQCLQLSSAAELRFLLGYVYYQIGRFAQAKNAIDAAYERSPDSLVVQALKKTIDQAIAPPPTKQ
jgi:tetratricopeptide (TPR) repeat protein